MAQAAVSLSFGARKPCIHQILGSIDQKKIPKTRFHFFVCPYLCINTCLFLTVKDNHSVMYVVCFYFIDWSVFSCNIFNVSVD